MATKYTNKLEEGLLANANCGGENVHRGAVLGALIGAEVGLSGIDPRLVHGLKDRDAISCEIDAFVASVLGPSELDS